jgi:PAS domain S-box-containing protein
MSGLFSRARFAFRSGQGDRDQADRQGQWHAAIVEGAEDAIISHTPDGTILTWNAEAEKLFGFTAKEAIGQSLSIIVPADRASELPANLARQIGGEHLKQRETVRQRKDGSLVPVSLTLSPVRDERGEIIGGAGILRDISDRQRAEQALREAEERMRFALEVSHVGVWQHEGAGDRVFWSDELALMHGVKPGTFGGYLPDFLATVHPDERDAVQTAIGQAISAQQRELTVEYRTVWPNGTEHRLSTTAHYTYGASGELTRGAGVTIDVTEQRSLEDQLRQVQKMEAVGQLAGGVAHDFNNMLNVIIGYAELVLGRLRADDANRADLQEIVRAAKRSAALTQQLVAFSRKQILLPRVLVIREVVGGVVPMLGRLLGEAIELRTIMSERGRVKADAGQLEQVLVNLALNARDAMVDGGVLTIVTSDIFVDPGAARQDPNLPAGMYVMIAVADTGLGMDAETRRRVFEPFFSTKGQGRGTGLGLASVYGVVTQSGGHITVHSELGRGSTFTIYLPSTTANAEVDQSAPSGTPVRGGGETILLVEDETALLAFAQKVLEQYGYAVHAYSDPLEAIAFASAFSGVIHLILSDVVLAGLTGPAMVARLRQSRADARVLYVSGYTADAIVRHVTPDAGVSFLPKPFSAAELMRKVREALDPAIAR